MLPVKNNFSRVILIAIVLSIALWGIAYQLAPDKSAFMKDHSFQYQIIWLPLHIFLGYFSILVYKKAAYAKHYKEISLSSILQDFKKNYRAVFFAVLLIIPFVVEDTLDGLVQLQTNFETLVIQIGSGSIVTTGYLDMTGYTATGNVAGASLVTDGFNWLRTGANQAAMGAVTLTLIDASTNTWVAQISGGNGIAALGVIGGGYISLSGILDRIRLTSTNGAGTFTAGKVNILWE